MDAVSYSHADKQKQRIEKFNANPDSNSGIVTVPKVIEAGESVTIPAGRVAVLPNLQVDGTLNVLGEVFIPAGTSSNTIDEKFNNRIGDINYSYVVKDDTIVAFGGEFNRADYPKLWAYLQANPTLVKTQTQWQTEATANGGICGFFSDGNGTTTFRVPNLDKAFLRPDSRSIASFQGDELKSHRHQAHPSNGSGNDSSNYFVSYSNARAGFSTHTGYTGGDETRPKNIAILPLIVAK